MMTTTPSVPQQIRKLQKEASIDLLPFNLDMRIENIEDSFSYAFLKQNIYIYNKDVLKNGNGNWEWCLKMEYTTGDVLELSVLHGYPDDVPGKGLFEFERVLAYATEVAKLYSLSAILLKGVSKEMASSVSFSSLSQERMQENDASKVLILSYSQNVTYYYQNLKSNYIENKFSLYDAFNSKIKQFKEKESTFSVLSFKKYVFQLSLSFYYKGFEGQIELKLNNDFVLEQKELNYVQLIHTPEDFLIYFDELIQQIEVYQRLKNLLNPPKKYFNEFFYGRLMHTSVISDAFDSLCEVIDPEKIEDIFSRRDEFLKHATHHYIFYLEVLDVQLVITKDDKVTRFTNRTQAIQYFKQCCLNEEEHSFNIKKQSVERVTEKLLGA